MDGLIFVAASATLTAIILAWKYFHLKKDVYDFAKRLETGMDEIIAGLEPDGMGETEDSLLGKIYEKLRRVNHIWQRKSEETLSGKKQIKELISDVSHQAKTPIANLKIYTDLLLDEPLSKKGNEFLSAIKNQTEKLDFLLDGMVKMSRLETGMIKIQNQVSDIWETLGEAIAAALPKAEQKQIKLYADCDQKILLLHDKKWTAEAFFNIIDNAVKYTEPGGNIHITVSVLEIFTKISIQDSGKGIAPGRQAEIFTRFYREPEVHEIEGLGIGLYLSRKIIELQNGYIEVRSEAGSGADFRIYLPNE